MTEPPTPTSEGTYAIYNTPKGGIHIVYRPLKTEEDQHLEIPAMIVKMAEKVASGETIGGPLGKIFYRKLKKGEIDDIEEESDEEEKV